MENKKTIALTLRIRPEQEVILQEVSDTLKVPKSVFIRAVIGDWLAKNEDCIYRLIDNKLNEKTKNGKEKTDFFAGVFDDDDYRN